MELANLKKTCESLVSSIKASKYRVTYTMSMIGIEDWLAYQAKEGYELVTVFTKPSGTFGLAFRTYSMEAEDSLADPVITKALTKEDVKEK